MQHCKEWGRQCDRARGSPGAAGMVTKEPQWSRRRAAALRERCEIMAPRDQAQYVPSVSQWTAVHVSSAHSQSA